MNEQAMKILIVGPSWVGDMVMAQTLFITLREQHPECQIDVLAPSWSRPILERMPEVRRAIDMPLGHGSLQLKVRRSLGHQLRGEHYDWSIVLPNSFKSALIPAWASIARRTGWRGEMRYGLLNDLRVLDKQRYPLMIERFIALGVDALASLPSPLPAPALQIDSESRQLAVQQLQLSTEKPVLALCPGAEFGESKRWPVRYYAEVAEQMIGQGWQVWILGSDKDASVGIDIQQHLTAAQQIECHNLAGSTTLAQAVDLLSLAGAVVSNDSGLMHIAAALHRPLVVVYGSTSAQFTPPLNRNHQVVSLGLDCSPCFKRECPLQHGNCLQKLSSDLVLQALQRLLDDPERIVVEGVE